ncbi:MAG: outer membrane beta-barrel protein [Bacteroidota bacterium]|nr:outer membrane beta-barrel protein [Bacteroidota bacterium]MDP4195917.1 outer membrane beta-barrel protein [Bacteroidota bacterium]
MFKKLLLLCMLLFTGFGFISAQGISIGIGPQLGWQKSSSADKGSLMYGAAIRFRISDAVGLEGSINYRSEDYANGALNVKTWPIMITGLIYPVNYFYGAIGIGWYNTTFNYGDQPFVQTLQNNTQQNFGWHLGAGVEIPANQRLNITADIRYVFLNYDFGDLARVANSGDLISNFFVITIGASFRIHM